MVKIKGQVKKYIDGIVGLERGKIVGLAGSLCLLAATLAVSVGLGLLPGHLTAHPGVEQPGIEIRARHRQIGLRFSPFRASEVHWSEKKERARRTQNTPWPTVHGEESLTNR